MKLPITATQAGRERNQSDSLKPVKMKLTRRMAGEPLQRMERAEVNVLYRGGAGMRRGVFLGVSAAGLLLMAVLFAVLAQDWLWGVAYQLRVVPPGYQPPWGPEWRRNAAAVARVDEALALTDVEARTEALIEILAEHWVYREEGANPSRIAAWEAREALVAIGEPAVPALRRAAEVGPEAWKRVHAAETLAQMGQRESFTYLAQLLDHDEVGRLAGRLLQAYFGCPERRPGWRSRVVG